MEKLEGGAEEALGPNQMTYEDNAFPPQRHLDHPGEALVLRVRRRRRVERASHGVGAWRSIPNDQRHRARPRHLHRQRLPTSRAAPRPWPPPPAPAAPPRARSTSAPPAAVSGRRQRTGRTPPGPPSARTSRLGDRLRLTWRPGALYVGTGEANGSSDSEAGLGLFKSTDGGRSFSKVQTASTAATSRSTVRSRRSRSTPTTPGTSWSAPRVARHGSSSVNGGRFTPPGAASSVCTRRTNGGATWTLRLSEPPDSVDPTRRPAADFFRGGISKLLFDPTHPGMAYASMFDYGLFRASPDGRVDTTSTRSTPRGRGDQLDNRVEFALGVAAGGKTRIYLGDATYFGDTVSGLLRTDDATAPPALDAAVATRQRHAGLRLVQLLSGPVLLRHGRGDARRASPTRCSCPAR